MAPVIVTKSPPAIVKPAEDTPRQTLSLSPIDTVIPVRVLVDSIHVYPAFSGGEHEVSPADAIRRGLAGALVPYYPLAGRLLADAVSGEFEVDCTGEPGVWFVEATANCSLDDVDGLTSRPLTIPKEELLPRAPPAEVANELDLILLLQVTTFTLGGFAIGCRASHVVLDGQGVAQFLNAVGELARGLPAPTVKPVWARDAIPRPPKPALDGPPPSITLFKFASLALDVSPETIERLKDSVAKEIVGGRCSTFDVLTAALFKCRTAAIGLPPDAHVHLSVAASVRRFVDGILPAATDGYYGNCIYHMVITKTSEEVTKASLAEVVAAVQEAKGKVRERFFDWLQGVGDDHYRVPLDYGTVTVSDWSRVGFDQVDFGWGTPSHVFPLDEDVNVVPLAIYLKPVAPAKGIAVVLRCVEERHVAALHSELKKLLH